MRLFSFGGYGLALAALALVDFDAYDSYPCFARFAILNPLGQREFPRDGCPEDVDHCISKAKLF